MATLLNSIALVTLGLSVLFVTRSVGMLRDRVAKLETQVKLLRMRGRQ